MNIDTKLGWNAFKIGREPHIIVKNEICNAVCTNRVCLYVCPAGLYEFNEEGNIVVDWEGCLECGTCLISCDKRALEWHYPNGEIGVQYRMG